YRGSRGSGSSPQGRFSGSTAKVSWSPRCECAPVMTLFWSPSQFLLLLVIGCSWERILAHTSPGSGTWGVGWVRVQRVAIHEWFLTCSAVLGSASELTVLPTPSIIRLCAGVTRRKKKDTSSVKEMNQK